ncbi:hypothetical protein [Streptomyces sp. NPDC001269]
MARGAPSPADLQVIRELASQELVVTDSQLESWRRAGLLPRHRRRGLGRGRGSVVDAVDPVVVESAAALARHLRQGRDRRVAVLEWFAETGMAARPMADQVPESSVGVVPEPAMGAVREALVWALERSVSHRLMQLARSAAGAGEEGQDALYAFAGRLTGPYRPAANPGLVRAALEAGEDVPVEAEGPDFRSLVHVVAAIGLGAQEVGTDALAEAFASFGLFGMTVEDCAQMLGAAERGEGPPVDWGLFERSLDAVGRVQRASDQELVRARTVLLGLREFYGLYVMHGLLMPDTPAQAALRQWIDDLGVFPLLEQVITIYPSPEQFSVSLTVCLEPLMDVLYEALMEQLALDPDVVRIQGDENGAASFMETWIRTLREMQVGEGAGHGRADDPDKRS